MNIRKVSVINRYVIIHLTMLTSEKLRSFNNTMNQSWESTQNLTAYGSDNRISTFICHRDLNLDGCKRRGMNYIIWGICIFLFLIIAMPIYYTVRKLISTT